MPISTVCPECSRKLRVPDALIGKRVKCPSCGLNFTVEGDEPPPAKVTGRKALPPPPPEPESDYEEVPDEEPPPEPDDPPDDDDDEPRPKKKKKKRRRDRDEYLAPNNSQLIMILGIVSIPVALFVVGLPGLIMGIVAIVMANNNLREIRAGRMESLGENEISTGKICGIVGTVIGGMYVAAFVLYILLVFGGCCCMGLVGSAGNGPPY